MRIKIFTSLAAVSVFLFNAAADNEKALKYLNLCLEKPASKYLFDHLYDSWDDEETSLEKELKKRLKQSPSPACQRLLLKLYEKEGRDSEALDACEIMLKNNPGEADLLLIKAQLEFNEHNYEQCAKDLLTALKDKKLSAKNAVEIKKILGRAWLRLDREKEALAVWKKLYTDNNDLEFGEDVLQLMLSEGLYEESMVLCKQLIKDCKNKFRNLELSIKLAEIYRLKGSRKKALAAYRTLLTQTGTGSWLEKELFSRIAQIYNEEDDSAGMLQFTADFLKEFPARTAIRLRYIDMLFTGGETDKALAAYLELIKKSPLNKDYRIAYAKMLVRAGKYAPAIDVYAGLAKRFPENSEYLFSKALVEIKADKKTAALKDLNAYLALNNTSEYVYIRTGKVLENAGMDKEAGEFYKKFIEKFSSSVDAIETYAVWLLRSEQTKEAVKLLTADNNLPLAILLRRSKLLLSYRQTSEAYNFLLRFEKEYKKDFRYNEELFAVCIVLNKQAEITKLIPVLLDTAANWDELKRAVSAACYALSKNNASEKYLQTLAAEKNLSPNMSCLRAVLQARYRGGDKALETLDAAIKNTPRVLMLYRQKAALLNSASEYLQAAETFKTLLKRDPKSRAEIYKQLIGMYERANDQKEALKWAAKLKREFPDSAISWMLLARLQEQSGSPDEAVKTLGRAAYRFPDNDELSRQLVTAYSRKGDMHGAINICWKILRKSRNPGTKLNMITQIYQLSNTEDLKTVLQNRLRIQMKNNPKDTFPLLALAEVAKLGYKYNEYRDYIQKASKLGKKSFYLLNKLAEIDEEQGNYTAAENTLLKLCEQDKSGKAELKLADFYFRSGDDEKALEIYRSYLRNHSDLNSLLHFAGDMLIRKCPDEAIAALKEKAVNSDNCQLHYLLGCAYEDADKTEPAVNEFTRVIELSDTLKAKTKTPQPNINTPWGIKFSPALEQLIFIQRMNWQVYQYRQLNYARNRYSSRLSPGSTAGILLPASPQGAMTMAICHLGKLNLNLSPEKQNELIKFLAACNVKYPELALLATNNNYSNINIDLKKILEKHPDDLELEMYICMAYNQQYIQQFGRKKLNQLLFKLCSQRPEYSSMLINYALQDTSEDKDKLVDLIIDKLLEKDDLSINNVHVLISTLNNSRIKLKQSRKNTIKDLAIKHFERLRRENKITSPYIVYSIVDTLLRNDFIDDARKLVEAEVAAEIKNPNASNPYINPLARYHRSRQGLNFTKQVFPLDPLIKLPGIINYALQGGYRADKKRRENFFKACEGVKDRRIELFAADGIGNKKNAEKIVAEIDSDPKSTLSEYALSAAWHFKENQPEKAYQTLLKARTLVKTKNDRKELNTRLISYALLIKDKEKVKKYVSEAAKKLLRLNLDVKEKVSLATVLQLAGLTAEAEEIESELLKKASGKSPSTPSVGSSPRRFDAYQRAEEKFKTKENESALNLMLREYHYWFRQSYNSFSINQTNIQLNPHQLRRVCELVKRYNCQDLMLKKLEPPASAMQIKKCEYAYACQLLGKNKLAEKIYQKVFEKNPKNRFAAFNYAMLLLKDNYSAAIPVLKTVPLEYLILISNNLHNAFTKADQILNFYDLLIHKLEQEKNFDLSKINNQAYLFTNMQSYLERNKHVQAENKNYPGVFDYLANPEKYKNKFTKFIPRQQELYLKFCEQLTRIAPVAENAFCRKLFLFEILKRDTKSLFEEGLRVMRLVNKSNLNIYNYNRQIYFNNRNHQLPDFDSYMVVTALKTKQVPKLLEVAKETVNSKSLISQIQDLEKLAQCPATEFVKEAEKLVDRETNINKRRDLQKLVVAIYQYRKLSSDLTPIMLKEIKLYDKDMMQTQDRFAGLQAWIEATAQRKDTEKLLKVLTRFTEFYANKYHKEFPEGMSETEIQSRFHQVFPWMAINIFRNTIQNILNDNPEKWYPVYKGLKPLLEIDMFAKQLNTYNLFEQLINRKAVDVLKYSPFTGTLEKIDFCPLLNYNGKYCSLYSLTSERIKNNSSWKKAAKEYLKGLAKPTVGAKLFEATLESSSDKVFELLAAPEVKFEQMPQEWQKIFCAQLATVLNNKTVSGNFKVSGRAGAIYRLYKRFAAVGTRQRLEKFYQEGIGNNYWNYSQKAGRLIADVAQNDPEEAAKIFEHALRKLKLFALQNPYNRIPDMQQRLLEQLRNNCHTLEACKVYYQCLVKAEKIQINFINNFYDKLRYVIEQEFNKLRNNGNLTAMTLVLGKIETAFRDCDIPLSYTSFNILYRINQQQLRQLIKSREAVKDKSKIAEQINAILNMRLESSSPGRLKAETVEKMWELIKDSPTAWKVAACLPIVNMPGGEVLAPNLAEPVLKMALEGDNEAKNRGIQLLIPKLALCKDNALIQKVAPPLINHYFLQLHSNSRNSRVNIPGLFALVYRTGNQKLIKKMLEDFDLAKHSSTYISLANLGDGKLIKSLLEKSWEKLEFYGSEKLSPDGLACAEKICEEIKEPEKKYVTEVLFATPRLYKKDKDGKINYGRYNIQSASLKKLADEFGAIKFSKKSNEIFCIQLLLNNSNILRTFSEKYSGRILALNINDILKIQGSNFSYRIGQIYFASLVQGNAGAVFEKINQLIQFSNSTDNGIQQQARRGLNGCAYAYCSSNIRDMTLKQVKPLAHLGRLLMGSKESAELRCCPQLAFFNYLAGKQEEFLKVLKEVPDNRRNFQSYQWRNQLRNIKFFCEKNKLNARKEISAFLKSAPVKETFKNNTAELTKLQTFFMQESCNSFEGFKSYYDSLQANNKTSVNMINEFYSKLHQFIRNKYNQLKKDNNNQKSEAMKILLKDYDDAFKNSDFVVSYECFQIFSYLPTWQMLEILNKRKALKNKSQTVSQLNSVLQSYLEIKQRHHVAPETAEKLWNGLKALPETWKIALGIVLTRNRGGEELSQYLAVPMLKMIKERKLSSYQLNEQIKNLAIINDETILKKTAPPLLNYYFDKIDNWSENNCRNYRTTIGMALNLAYRTGDVEQVKKLIANPKINKYADIYICLANAGAKEILKDALDKNWRNLCLPSRIILFPDAAAMARQITASFKDPEEKYFTSVLFAGSSIYRKDKDGNVDQYLYRDQRELTKELAGKFGKIKFSNDRNKLFCFSILLRNWKNIDALAETSADNILSIPLTEIIDYEDYIFQNQIGSFYFACCRFGKEKTVTEKIKKLVDLYQNSEDSSKHRARNILSSFFNTYSSFNLRDIKTAQAKAFADLAIIILNSGVNSNQSFPWNAAFFSYVADDQKTFIAALKKMPPQKRNFYLGSWGHYLRNIEYFCKQNNLNYEKVIMGLVNSDLIKELCQNKISNIKKINDIKKNISTRFAKEVK